MTAKAMANHLASALDNGLPRPIVSEAARNSSRAIHSLYDEATGRFSPPASASVDLPLVTVCITHYQRIGKLREALRSVLAQTYPRIEIIVVDDGSPDAEVQAELDRLEPELHRHGGRLIRRENGYLGAARNSGAAAARGRYVCFLDDDDLALPDMVQTLVTAAGSTGAEIVSGLQTPMPNSRRDEALPDPLAFPGKVEFFPLGGPLALTLTHYCLANASSLILLSAFQEIGGYTELRDVGGEDHEFYTRALQNGMRIEISPHLAYLYETGIPSMWGKYSHLEHMARVADSVELDHRAARWRDLLLLTAGERARHVTAVKRKWRLAKSHHRNTLQSLYDSTDLKTQLRHLSGYAHQLGRDDLAGALHATLIAQKNQTQHKHTVPEPVVGGRGTKSPASLQTPTEGVDQPEGMQDLLRDLTTDTPIFVQKARLNEIRHHVRRGMSKSTCRSVLAELEKLEATGQDRSRFLELLFELALRGEDWPMAAKMVNSASETDEAAYLHLYPDVARAVEQRAFRGGLQHYVKWGRKEGRTGYAQMATLSSVATTVTGQDIQPDRLRKTLRQLSSRRPSSNESAANRPEQGSASLEPGGADTQQLKIPVSACSAEMIAEKLTLQGVERSDICGDHLTEVYERLATTHERPDLHQIEEILTNLPPGGSWGEQASAVIVETRAIPQLAYAIGTVVRSTGLPVQLFHAAANRSILADPDLASLRREGRLVATEMRVTRFDHKVYNTMMLDRRFYEAMQGRGHFLIFQADSLCCPAADFGLDDFASYDYVGASWNESRPVGLRIRGGCGGFSYRSWQASVDMLKRFPAAFWRGGEDGYFAFHMDLAGYRVATAETSSRFATQDAFRHRSFGAHQVCRLPEEEYARFMQYCPEAWMVLSAER